MSRFGTVLGEREDFGAVFCHQDRMLELSGGGTISGANGPAVVFITLCVTSASVDHWFNGEAHSGFQAVDSALSSWEVGNRWIEMEFFTQSMAYIFTNDTEPSAVSFRDD